MARKAGLADRLTVLEPPLEEVKCAAALRKGQPEILARLDQAMAELQASPEYQAIYTKWHDAKLPDLWTTGRVLAIMSLLLVAAMAGMGLWRLASVSRLNLDLFASMSQLRQVQESLRDSEEKLGTLFETMLAGLIMVDERGVIIFANQRIAQMVDCTME